MTEAQIVELKALDVDEPDQADPFPSMGDRPCWRCYDEAIERDGKKVRPGVHYHGIKESKGDAPPIITDTWHCGPLHIESLTANQEDGDHGLLLHFRNVNGNWRKWAMPKQMLAGDGTEVLSVLYADGLDIDRKSKARVLDYINSQHPKDRLRAASTTGWHGGAFVLPDEVIGASDIWFQATERTAPYGTAGSFEGWKEQVAARASSNPMLTLGLSAALAGPLLEKINIGGGGLHLFGDSSKGKTSILMAAVSVWGGPAFLRTWRTTSNGLEGAARMHTETLLPLDEINQCEPKQLYEAAYELINGQGKTRANVKGEARQAARWRVFVLSNGEMSIPARIAEGGMRVKAGQTLRLLDVPATSQTHGAFDDLHGFASGAALSDAIRDGAARHYGHAGRAFVQAMIDAEGLELPDKLQSLVQRFEPSDGQEARAATVFALCGVAGELAREAGIVPWEPAQAIKAALLGFNLWRNQRGTQGRNAEDAAILRMVADFIDKHGDSRFSGLDDHNAPPVRDRAGYWKDGAGGKLFLLTAGGLGEATKGYDMKRVIRALDDAGALAEKDAGRKTRAAWTPSGTKRLYHVDPSKLDSGDQS